MHSCILFWASVYDSGGNASGCSDGKSAPGRTGGCQKTLVRSIKCAFPGWLMDIVLLLQSENVQVALQKSQEHVPPVLRRDLDILVGQLEMEPESVLPYHRFLKSFQIPEVHSAMSMLFSVSMGNSGRADRQIGELIDRNLEMLDVAEKGRLKKSEQWNVSVVSCTGIDSVIKTSCGYGSVYDDISVRGRTWIKGRRIQNEPDHEGIHGSIPDSFYGGDSNGNSGSLYGSDECTGYAGTDC